MSSIKINEDIRRWPEGATVYQIYPRSFQDSNDDGVGDLPGIISRLDYLVSLGVNAIWLSPFYPSPMADFGYDVSDYCNIDPIFGNMKDFKKLLVECEKRQIKLIIDLVPNHTSDEHIWFKESRKSKQNLFNDWYIWKDGIFDNEHHSIKPPNNWLDALTGESAWQWDVVRKQFYLHSFDVRQPDLNWSNPKVREAIKNVMRYWLNLGVDGFRIDAVYWLAKEPLFSDDDVNPHFIPGKDPQYESLLHNNSRGWPVVYAYLAEMAEVLKEPLFNDKHRFMVTEAYPEGSNPLADYMTFYVGMDPLVAAPFNFECLSMPWDANSWRRFLTSFHTALGTFNKHCVASYAFGNHDKPRLASRLGEKQAKCAAVLLMTLPGMIFIYYGEELGMKNVYIAPDRVVDPAAKNDPENGQGRDPSRTPMQWANSKNAGFTESDDTWLPLSTDFADYNVEDETKDLSSSLAIYRSLGKLRREAPALRYGAIDILEAGSKHVLAYRRHLGEDNAYITLINFSDKLVLFECEYEMLDQVISTFGGNRFSKNARKGSGMKLRPHEAVVFLAEPSFGE